MREFINRALEAAKHYNVWDWGCLKVTLASIGILLGAYFAQFFMQYIYFVWAIFILSYVWIMGITFFKYWNKW